MMFDPGHFFGVFVWRVVCSMASSAILSSRVQLQIFPQKLLELALQISRAKQPKSPVKLTFSPRTSNHRRRHTRHYTPREHAKKVARIRHHFGSYTIGNRRKSKITIVANYTAHHSSRPALLNKKFSAFPPPCSRLYRRYNPEIFFPPIAGAALFRYQNTHAFTFFKFPLTKTRNKQI